MKTLCRSLFALLLLLAAGTSARAQWETVTYQLKGGWNAIYLHGDAVPAAPEAVFPSSESSPSPVLEVWRWNPNPSLTQFETSPLVPTTGTSDWSVWRRHAGTSPNTLGALVGRAAYLVRCSGGTGDTYEVQMLQRVLPPGATWVRNGANFLGFPAGSAGGGPTFSSYFATFPAATAANGRIYKYVGGELGTANPLLVFQPELEALDRTKAYWFEAPVVSNFYAPFEFSLSNAEGLVFGRAGTVVTLRLRNRTNTAVTLTATPLDSAAPGTPAIAGRVPLTLVTRNGAGETVSTLISAPFPTTVPPQSTVTLEFGIDRTQMSATPGAFYASRLSFTDAMGLVDVRLPASALVPSLAGLWVGEISATNVSAKNPALYYTCEVVGAKSKVESRAIGVGASTLVPLSLPPDGGPYTYKWKKNGAVLPGEVGDSLVLSEADAAASGAFGTGTARAASLRTILHVSETGVAKLLPQVFFGKLAAPPHDLGLGTRESHLDPSAKASATRLSSVHLPPGATPSVTGTVALPTGSGAGTVYSSIVCTVELPFQHGTNPFFHTYHPDHDNKSPRGVALDEGIESYTVNRVCTFRFTASLPGVSPVGWGSSVLGGTYTEVITGLHRAPLTVTGTFLLRRVSELGTLVSN